MDNFLYGDAIPDSLSKSFLQSSKLPLNKKIVAHRSLSVDYNGHSITKNEHYSNVNNKKQQYQEIVESVPNKVPRMVRKKLST